MSKRKDTTNTTSSKLPHSAKSAPSTCKQAKKSSICLKTLEEEIEKLENPEEIARKSSKLHDQLMKEWNKDVNDRDLGLIEVYLGGAKVLFTKMQFLPLCHVSGACMRDMQLARDILEIGALYSVIKCESEKNSCSPKGLEEFERYISQLKHYYFDMKKYFSRESERMYEILGMNLLNLLSQYKIADFHRELELFIHPNVDEVMKNPYIKKAVEIEKYIMEGQYNKIYALKGAKQEDLNKAGLTSLGFKYFIDHLETTLKEHTNEIAEVIGAAYDKLSITAAMKLLNLSDSNKLGEIINKQNWKVKEGYIYFHTKGDDYGTVPAAELIRKSLTYAEELETIV